MTRAPPTELDSDPCEAAGVERGAAETGGSSIAIFVDEPRPGCQRYALSSAGGCWAGMRETVLEVLCFQCQCGINLFRITSPSNPENLKEDGRYSHLHLQEVTD